ncbi:glycosyl transferase family 90 [Pedobacter frigoris]|uniref:Lipopolysaccharide biosynthesis protein n=1 Tax=Pedobacter frigoris TaxID=2571272 RepID=A0A4U1CAC2_9SPHI|nr:glycosyl transferase family 90 [Pedobacter frigoris]TKC02919.1 lipopolysaccharide biosynthesis protein [Pedobacter frigoris]
MRTPLIFQQVQLIIKKNKLSYYTVSFIRWVIPAIFYRRQLTKKLAVLNKYDMADVMERVNYYNKLERNIPIGKGSIPVKDLRKFKKPKAYYFDTFEYARYFNPFFRLNLLIGDITYVAGYPTIQKSRPIGKDNANGVLLKLDKHRHFIFLNDQVKFEEKKDVLIGRAAIRQPHRMRFMEMYFNHPMCDLGQVNKSGGNIAWLKPKISITEHLQYKFILSLEGYDVATNLKWIMSSNSIAVMPKPKYETWFMEGCLVPDFHYILIKDDYSDLEERLLYFINHPDKALKIISNANDYVKQFLNKDKEDLISILVLKKYFECTSS